MEEGICEICGRPARVRKVLIEGAEMEVCASCAKLGKGIQRKTPDRTKIVGLPKVRKEIDIVENYGQLIKQARVKQGLTVEALARKLNEKAGYLEMVEKEKTLPSQNLARKLEKALGIQLLTEVVEEIGGAKESKKPELTLADVVVIERKGGRDGG